MHAYHAPPRGPQRTIVSSERDPQTGLVVLTLSCGHLRHPTPTATYLAGDAYPCFLCLVTPEVRPLVTPTYHVQCFACGQDYDQTGDAPVICGACGSPDLNVYVRRAG